MSTLNKILFLAVVASLFYGCSPRTIKFSTDNFTNPSFYQSLPLILNKNLRIDSVITYETTFEEKPYEGYYVIDYSEVNSRNDNNILHYKNFKGYYQKLYLLKLVTYPKDSVTIYFSIKYNAFDQCIGFGPSYIGTMDEKRSLIFFNAELYTRNKKNNYSLRKVRVPLALYMNVSELMPGSYINVDKMIVEKSFEIGNNVVIDIPRIFHDSAALKFEYIDARGIK
jgi:hypothetical protein